MKSSRESNGFDEMILYFLGIGYAGCSIPRCSLLDRGKPDLLLVSGGD
jgi:hypothetical protein